VSDNIHVCCAAVIAGKPAPTGSAVFNPSGSNRGFLPCEHETFVMKLNGLRLNVAYFAGCRTFADSARMGCRTLPFT
jgi:hypothetical protein